MNLEEMTHDDYIDAIDNLEIELKEAQEEISILNEILDEIYDRAQGIYNYSQEIMDMIP